MSAEHPPPHDDAPHIEGPSLYAALFEGQQNGWALERLPISPNSPNQVYRALNPEGLVVAVKCYATRAAAEREFAVLQALRDFGINLAPAPYLLGVEAPRPTVVMEWIAGEGLRALPDEDDVEGWHRLLAMLGAPADLPFGPYARVLPLRLGLMQPQDMLAALSDKWAVLQACAPAEAEKWAGLLAKAKERVNPQWSPPPKVGLMRRNFELSNFLWDGYHLRVLDWTEADWGDVAAEIGLWSAHPTTRAYATPHWVWVRWEFARLTRDQTFPARATLYGQLGLFWWGLTWAERAQHSADPLLGRTVDELRHKALKIFGR